MGATDTIYKPRHSTNNLAFARLLRGRRFQCGLRRLFELLGRRLLDLLGPALLLSSWFPWGLVRL